MKLSEFHYDLPESAIAQEPISPRDHSKLLVLDRKSRSLTHTRFDAIVDFLRPNDVLVLNATKVFPARLRGHKTTGGKIEVLLLEPLEIPNSGASFEQFERSSTLRLSNSSNGVTWRSLVRGTTKPVDLVFPEGLKARMTERLAEGEWKLEFSSNHIREYLDRHGEMPLPPYIKRPAPRSDDLKRYQTVFAETEGAVAAPTAGFHFTEDLLAQVKAKGVTVEHVVLHVGWGTFRPVRTETIEDHSMLAEAYNLSEATANTLTDARRKGRRIIAVGTTAVRTLETTSDGHGGYRAGRGKADLFIYPGYQFKGVDALITNFHLPDSTPLLLACAFYGGTVDNPFSLRRAYADAIQNHYRFYSYGDAMFIQ